MTSCMVSSLRNPHITAGGETEMDREGMGRIDTEDDAEEEEDDEPTAGAAAAEEDREGEAE